jgi:Family of unknown function (DUF5947)
MTISDRDLEPGKLAALQRFTRTRAQAERCELCGVELTEKHPHLLETRLRGITCACPACAILFCGQEGGRFLRIPQKVRRLDDFVLSDLEWEELTLPIQLAFFVRTSAGKMIAMYPSPAGAVESLLDLGAWNGAGNGAWSARFARHAALSGMAAEVEALLVNRIGNRHAYFLVPIDQCYKLVGLVRMKWRGLSGGPELWVAIHAFFNQLEQTAAGVQQVRHA